MAEFQYKARDANGATRNGTVQAASRSLAASQLKGRGFVVLGVEPIADNSPSGGFRIDWQSWLRPRPVDIELSLQQLAMMLRGGMTLLTSIVNLIDQAPRKSLAAIWESVVEDIQTGDSLSNSLTKHKCIPEFVVQMIRVGERTGELPPVLERSVETMRSRRRGVQEVVSALIYPLLVILVAVAVTIYMIVYLIPRLEIYLESLGKDMPAMTQNLVNMSVWLRQYYALIGIAMAAIGVGIFVTYSSREGRLFLDRAILRIPFVGGLIKLCETSTFARSLSIMLGSGITLIDGLGTVRRLLLNRFAQQSVDVARDKIIQGSNFSDAIDEHGAFSPMLRKMIAVGQQSGDLKGVLKEVADFQDDQFQSLIRRLNAIVTPLLTVGVGGIVGYVYIAFFVALFAAGS